LKGNGRDVGKVICWEEGEMGDGKEGGKSVKMQGGLKGTGRGRGREREEEMM